MTNPIGAKPPKTSLATRFSYGRRLFALIWEASGSRLIAWAVLLLVQGVIPVAVVWLTKPLVNSLQVAVGGGLSRTTIEPLLTTAAALGVLMMVGELLRTAQQWIGMAQSELVQDHVSDLLHAKASELDLSFFETPEFYDRLYRVRFDAASRPLALLESVGGLAQNVITVVGIGALLLGYGVWVSVVLVVGTIPALFVVVRSGKRQHDWWLQTTTDRRRAHYFGDLLTMGQYASEMRLFGVAPHFRERFRELRRRLRTERFRLFRQASVSRLGAEAIALLSAAGAIGWMVWRAIQGAASLGDVALFGQAFQRGQGLVRSLLTNIGQVHNNQLFLENLFEYLDLAPVVVTPPDPVAISPRSPSLRFHDVSFRYPGTDRLALSGFNLTVPAGRIVAIVGSNGAGKSTLVKLLCRFYDPETGRVEMDGIDLRRYDPVALRRSITVMFQAPVAYQGSVRENITLGSLDRIGANEDVERAARESGLTDLVDRLPSKYDTILGKAFDGGTELSAGEWQRVAMARSYFKRSGLIILDEPTSAMDSWAEEQWFERFRRLAADATAIIITHRLTIARRADEIHVVESGKVVESGSHDALLGRGGRYASSWSSQVDRASASPAVEPASN